MSSSSAQPASATRSKKGDAPTEPTETKSIVFEWPLFGLKQMFDASKAETKSKVVKSAPFGGGRWTVLFYAQSGLDQCCAVYLNAEPLPHERVSPLAASASAPLAESSINGTNYRDGSSASRNKNKIAHETDEKWIRQGVYKFTFEMTSLDRSVKLGTKEAHDHAFSHKTSNWGWAQFAKRDAVYYTCPAVKQTDGVLISVTVTDSAQRPSARAPEKHHVPPVLISAMGSLLDDPEHSDVVFHLLQPPSRNGHNVPPKKIYAIKKVLALRSEYFRDMFESGFIEGETAEVSDESDEEMDLTVEISHAPKVAVTTAPPQRDASSALQQASGSRSGARSSAREYDAATAISLQGDNSNEGDESFKRGPDVLLEDSDEDMDDEEDPWGSRADSPTSSADTAAAEDSRAVGSEDENTDEENGFEEDDIVSVATRAPLQASDGSGVGLNASQDAAKDAVDHSDDVEEPESGHFADLAASERGREQHDSEAQNPGRSHVPSRTSSARGSPRPSPRKGVTRDRKESVNPVTSPRSKRRACAKAPAPNGRKRRKVVVGDSAYSTFKALLFFLYTDAVEFAPLTSSFLVAEVSDDTSTDGNLVRPASSLFLQEMNRAHQRRQAVIDTYCAEHPDKPAPCSAKAMYKLADKLQLPELKKRAETHIAKSLTTQNIVWEAFSGFNTRYPDIMHMEIDFLLKHWSSVKKSTVMKTIFARHTAHPGLAFVWPLVLEHLSVSHDEDAEDKQSPVA
ncbi:hypothetical protein IE81DRAFT_321630 [Ceraceosorus guamensis]|uniref:BTB domain-containing protein n=1 Tax=Ceraceosorus guamensis TaxID=1522189 RepID=A0A316W513_9BASI|nr:hypothetical protein IE81DRAFT_321630 [Ceraceosorus guamensis]PWN44228.1 hypothetical protein IE81DRAFT_321630 [Ceraceosorus guamensis]